MREYLDEYQRCREESEEENNAEESDLNYVKRAMQKKIAEVESQLEKVKAVVLCCIILLIHGIVFTLMKSNSTIASEVESPDLRRSHPDKNLNIDIGYRIREADLSTVNKTLSQNVSQETTNAVSFVEPVTFERGQTSDFGIDNWYIIPEKKFLACAIPKAGSQSMRRFGTSFGNCKSDYMECGRASSTYHLTKDDIQKYLEDPSWTKIAFFRDPRERFLSGYLDKCLRKCCESCINFNEPPSKSGPTFSEFIREMRMNGWAGFTKVGNKHFLPQSWQCGAIAKTIGFLDFIGVIGDVNETFEQMLLFQENSRFKDDVRMKELIKKHYGREDLSNGTYAMTDDGTHNVHKRSSEYMEEYYTEENSEIVKGMFVDDYMLFKKLVKHPKATDLLKRRFSYVELEAFS